LVENLVNLIKREGFDLRSDCAGASQFQHFFKVRLRPSG